MAKVAGIIEVCSLELLGRYGKMSALEALHTLR